MRKIQAGLEDVVVAATRLSSVDGARGELIIAGVPVETLAVHGRYLEVMAQLFAAAGVATSAVELAAELHARVCKHVAMHARWSGAQRDVASGFAGRGEAVSGEAASAIEASAVEARGEAARGEAVRAGALDAMAAVRSAIAHVPSAGLNAPVADALSALAATLTATVVTGNTLRRAVAPVTDAADASFDLHAPALAALSALAVTPAAFDPAAFLLEGLGVPHGAPQVQALRRYWVTVSDHGMNASTFAARVVASTQADMIGALTAASCALAGPLHGGAPGPVLDMLDAVATPAEAAALSDERLYARARASLDKQLAAGQRIMGMGHRIYRVRDPRAAALEAVIATLEADSGATSRMRVARQTEAAALELLRRDYPDRELCANVEFYTAVLLDALAIPRELFTALFACGRIAGWAAHVMEQRSVAKLIRPASVYVGAAAST